MVVACFQIASFLAVLWCISILGYLFGSFIGIPPMAMPLATASLLILLLINPIKIFCYRARMWLLRILVNTHACMQACMHADAHTHM